MHASTVGNGERVPVSVVFLGSSMPLVSSCRPSALTLHLLLSLLLTLNTIRRHVGWCLYSIPKRFGVWERGRCCF